VVDCSNVDTDARPPSAGARNNNNNLYYVRSNKYNNLHGTYFEYVVYRAVFVYCIRSQDPAVIFLGLLAFSQSETAPTYCFKVFDAVLFASTTILVRKTVCLVARPCFDDVVHQFMLQLDYGIQHLSYSKALAHAIIY